MSTKTNLSPSEFIRFLCRRSGAFNHTLHDISLRSSEGTTPFYQVHVSIEEVAQVLNRAGATPPERLSDKAGKLAVIEELVSYFARQPNKLGTSSALRRRSRSRPHLQFRHNLLLPGRCDRDAAPGRRSAPSLLAPPTTSLSACFRRSKYQPSTCRSASSGLPSSSSGSASGGEAFAGRTCRCSSARSGLVLLTNLDEQRLSSIRSGTVIAVMKSTRYDLIVS